MDLAVIPAFTEAERTERRKGVYGILGEIRQFSVVERTKRIGEALVTVSLLVADAHRYGFCEDGGRINNENLRGRDYCSSIDCFCSLI
jgi:hypothetical protein